MKSNSHVSPFFVTVKGHLNSLEVTMISCNGYDIDIKIEPFPKQFLLKGMHGPCAIISLLGVQVKLVQGKFPGCPLETAVGHSLFLAVLLDIEREEPFPSSHVQDSFF